MTEAYATLDDLRQRLDFEMDAGQERLAVAALEDASDEAREYGRDWSPQAVPRLVRSIVLKACVRYLRNPDGYTSSRAGDETVTWSDRSDPAAGAVSFTRDEIALLQELAGKRAGLTAVPVTAWSPSPPRPGSGRVPVDGGGTAFPLFPDGGDPW